MTEGTGREDVYEKCYLEVFTNEWKFSRIESGGDYRIQAMWCTIRKPGT